MLESYIIKEIQKIEEERSQREQPTIPLIPNSSIEKETEQDSESIKEERGVVIIDLGLS